MRLNLSHKYGDSTLNGVLDVITTPDEERIEDATGTASAASVLGGKLSATSTGTVLDLIPHSQQGVLQIAKWDLGSKTKAEGLYKALGSLAVTVGTIRLLGCNTGYMKAGKACMKMLRTVFKTATICGSRVPVGSGDFDSQGFTKDSYLDDHTGTAAGTVSGAIPDAVVISWHHRFPSFEQNDPSHVVRNLERETFVRSLGDWALTLPRLRWPVREAPDRDHFEAFVTLCAREMVVARGLLALPEREVIVRIGGTLGAPRLHRLTLLLDGCFLRMYPRGHPAGVILRVPAGSRKRIDDLFAACTPVSTSTLLAMVAPPVD